ncbi:28S ribosomal protein S18c, mitochondrial [Megalops cyprinoides]|uniref:28S ribosomal protein S18c, mitochondrial n=1 Tax=Megalops cyprinoides TaxID=118141 RepID=UPI001863D926|nr:28S ribosomal protein S18c, mitochondrial [Megalops cyprinoides]
MFPVRSGQFVYRALSHYTIKHCTQGQCLRSFSSTAHEIQKSRDDLPIQMENPFKEPTKGCILCNVEVDFKNVQLLSQFVSPHTGRIYGRHITGLCGRKQRQISKAIKKAQHMGFMSVTLKDPAFLKDPNICNIKHLE